MVDRRSKLVSSLSPSLSLSHLIEQKIYHAVFTRSLTVLFITILRLLSSFECRALVYYALNYTFWIFVVVVIKTGLISI